MARSAHPAGTRCLYRRHPPAPHPPDVDELPAAEEFPALYRAILDRVDRLERSGERAEAARIRAEATRAYSESWDATHRRRLELVLRRVERALEARPRSSLGKPIRPPEPV